MSRAIDRLPRGVVMIERDWLSSNHVLLFDDDRATIIDTGYGKHAATTGQLVAAALRNNPHGGTARLQRILNTHLHSDHCGGNATLAAAHECTTYVPAASLAAVRNWPQMADEYDSLAQRCQRFEATGAISPGEIIHGGGLDWTVHAAPGHDPRSLIFFNPEHRILLSADALWQYGFGVIFPEIFDQSGFAEQAAVLELIESLEPAVVIPGHGPAFDDVADALTRARRRLDKFVAQPLLSHQHALKVMIKFLLLDREQIGVAQLHDLAERTLIFQELARQLNTPMRTVIDTTVAALQAQQQLRRQDDILFNDAPQ